MARKSPAQVIEKPVLEKDTPANSVVSQSHTETTIVEETILETELNQPDIQPHPNDDVRLKFEVEVDTFNSKLSTALLAVPLKPTHPNLSNVLLTAQEGQVTLTGFDFNLGITISCDARVEIPGAIALPAKLLQNIVSRMPVGKVTVEARAVQVGLLVTLTCASGQYQIRGTVRDDFPTLPELDANSQSFRVKTLLLAAALRCVLFAAATEETKQVLTGVRCQFDADGIELATTDSYRLAIASIPKPYAEGDNISSFCVTIPATKLQQLERILSTTTADTVLVAFDKSKGNLTIGTTQLVIRLLEGDYPQYRHLIPRQLKTTVRVERKQLVNGLERLAVLTDKNYVVVARVNQPEQSVTLTVETADLGSGFETLEAQITGESLEIGLNIKYLLEGLKKLDTAWVQLQMNAPTTPAIVSPVESLIPTTQVLMPIEIN